VTDGQCGNDVKFFDVEAGKQIDRPRTTVWGLVLFRSLKQLKNVLNVGL
jgi:hypothetical protein